MPIPKFKFKGRVEVIRGFFEGRTGTVQGYHFKWWPYGFYYAVAGDPDQEIYQPVHALESMLYGANRSSFHAVIAEKHLRPAKEKTLFADASGAVTEKTNPQGL